MDEELLPAEPGTVEMVGDMGGTVSESLTRRMVRDIERHGEVHARFEDVDDGLVECRLATTLVDFDSATIEVYDGDQYKPFGMDNLVDWEVPMETYHG